MIHACRHLRPEILARIQVCHESFKSQLQWLESCGAVLKRCCTKVHRKRTKSLGAYALAGTMQIICNDDHLVHLGTISINIEIGGVQDTRPSANAPYIMYIGAEIRDTAVSCPGLSHDTYPDLICCIVPSVKSSAGCVSATLKVHKHQHVVEENVSYIRFGVELLTDATFHHLTKVTYH